MPPPTHGGKRRNSGRKAQPKKSTITVRLDTDTANEFREQCERRGVSQARLIDHWIRSQKAQDKATGKPYIRTRADTGKPKPKSKTKTNMRAKFILNKIENAGTDTDPAERLTFNAVTDKEFNEQGDSDDNTFARYTPSGELIMVVNNPAIVGTMKTGQKFYLDFTPAD